MISQLCKAPIVNTLSLTPLVLTTYTPSFLPAPSQYLLRLQPSLASSPYEKLFSTPPTHFASTSDSARVLGLLLSNLPPTAATCINGNGDSILHMACESGATDIVAFLVKVRRAKGGLRMRRNDDMHTCV